MSGPVNSGRLRVGLTMALFVVVIGAGVWWLMYRGWVSTDDAFVEARIVEVAPSVAGRVLNVKVNDNERIVKDQLIVEIDPRDIQSRLDQALAALALARAEHKAAESTLELTLATTKADIDEARAEVETARALVTEAEAKRASVKAEYERAKTDADRYRSLDDRAVSRRQHEQIETKLASARADLKAAAKNVSGLEASVLAAQSRLAAAEAAPHKIAVQRAAVTRAAAVVDNSEAAVREARLQLSYTQVRAPESGRVARKRVQPGNFVRAGQILMALVADQRWVIANYKETQLEYIHPGQRAEISVDAFPDTRLNAHVESIQPGSGARFSLLPPENATGNWVKVVQRVPVKLVFDEPPDLETYPLGPGMSVVSSISVK